MDNKKVINSLKDLTDYIINEVLKEEEKVHIRNLRALELNDLHFTLALYLRNNYCLNNKVVPKLISDCKKFYNESYKEEFMNSIFVTFGIDDDCISNLICLNIWYKLNQLDKNKKYLIL